MKEKILSIIQKVAVMFIACLMLIGVLPIGLIPHSDFSAEGEFVRIGPSEEIYANSKSSADVVKIGDNAGAYFKFDIGRFFDVDEDEIKSVKLRFAFLNGSGTAKSHVVLDALPGEGRETAKAKALGLSVLGERRLADIFPQTEGVDDSLCETDVTEYVKDLLKQERQSAVFGLSGEGEAEANLALSHFSDPAYRPTLKFVIGMAEDTDAATLKKAEIDDAVYVSGNERSRTGAELAGRSGGLRVGGSNEIYLRFRLNIGSDLGEVYSARLSLMRINAGEERSVKIYCINNDSWKGDEISYSMRPRGEEAAATLASADGDGRTAFDVTQAVCEARNMGRSTLTFRIVGAGEGADVDFFGRGEAINEPKLLLGVTDDESIVCAAQAAMNALGRNTSANYVTMNLADSYTSESGNYAKIRWVDNEKQKKRNRFISENGEVTRPAWFEGDERVCVSAEIRSGEYVTEREFELVIPAETSPDYSRLEFGNYIDIGNGQSEREQKFEYVNLSGAKRRWVGGSVFTYRTVQEDCAMALNFSCEPNSENYLTLKLWEGDGQGGDFVASVCGTDIKPIELAAPDNTEDSEAGFVYATYALPAEATVNRSMISLCISCAENKESASAAAGRGIYAAYLTQSPFFEPRQFEKQGEKVISASDEAGTISRFIETLRSLSIPIGGNGENAERLPSASNKKEDIIVDSEAGSVVFTGEEANIAFSIDAETGTAVVYQKLENYDRYSENCPVIFDDGLVTIDYGDYKLTLNSSAKERELPYDRLELSGAYKELLSGNYYTFSEDWQMTDDSVIPEGTDIMDGKQLSVGESGVVLLMHVAEPMQNSDWRVSHVNGRNAAEINFGSNEQVTSVTVKAVGGTAPDAENVSIILAVYEGGKITAINKENLPLSESVNIYTADFAKYNMFMKNGCTLKIFVSDDTEIQTELEPKIEL